MQDKWELKEEDFGELLPFIKDKNVTDIDYNGYALWITDLKKGRYKADVALANKFINEFAKRVADYVNKQFNQMNCTLEAQTDELRITITHNSVSMTGISFEIRKALPEVRHTIESMLTTKYCQLPVLNLLINCVKARMNIVFCGETGVGKTEGAKFFSQFIPESDRIITIEDNLEMHLHEIYPEKDVVELLVNETAFGYNEAIRHCLRKHPNWIILTEARSEEAKFLLQQWSTGLKGFTTLHVDDLRNLPDRYMNMIGSEKEAKRLENSIYEYINIGILIRLREVNGEMVRYMDQVAIYDRESGRNNVHMIVENGKLVSTKVPKRIMAALKRSGVTDPFAAIETLEYENPDIDLRCVKGA